MRLTKPNNPKAIIAAHRIPKENAKGLKSGVAVLLPVRVVTELNNEKMKITYSATVAIGTVKYRMLAVNPSFFPESNDIKSPQSLFVAF